MKLPSLKKPLTHNRIGGAARVSINSQEYLASVRMEVVSCVVTHPVSKDDVRGIFALKRDYFGKFDTRFEGPTQMPGADADSGDAATNASQLSSKICLYVHAKAIHAMQGAVANLAASRVTSTDTSLVGIVCHPVPVISVIRSVSGYNIGALGIANIDSLVKQYVADTLTTTLDQRTQNQGTVYSVALPCRFW